jgi:ATP synthase protein I
MLTGPTRVALAQAGMAPLIAIFGFVFSGGAAALAACYGVLVALAASLLIMWRERVAIQHPEWGGRKLFGLFIRTGLERLFAVVVLLAVGFGVLKLAPLPLLLGLAVAQTGWLAAGMPGRNRQ